MCSTVGARAARAAGKAVGISRRPPPKEGPGAGIDWESRDALEHASQPIEKHKRVVMKKDAKAAKARDELKHLKSKEGKARHKISVLMEKKTALAFEYEAIRDELKCAKRDHKSIVDEKNAKEESEKKRAMLAEASVIIVNGSYQHFADESVSPKHVQRVLQLDTEQRFKNHVAIGNKAMIARNCGWNNDPACRNPTFRTSRCKILQNGKYKNEKTSSCARHIKHAIAFESPVEQQAAAGEAVDVPTVVEAQADNTGRTTGLFASLEEVCQQAHVQGNGSCCGRRRRRK